MKMYYASLGSMTITEVYVERRNYRYVFREIEGDKKEGTRCVTRRKANEGYFDTWEDAYAFLQGRIDKIMKNIHEHLEVIKYSQKALDNMRAQRLGE
jgi:hypothetical protein